VAKLNRSIFFSDFNDVLLHNKPDYLERDTYYNQDRLWGNALSEDEEDRVHTTRAIIRELQDIHTILDAGCGDGRVSNVLKNRYRVVSIDISEAALKHVKPPKVNSTIDHIPFRKKEFDLVMATDVIEHLQDSIYHRAIAELKRVSSRFILIGVPFNQQLILGICRCVKCGHRFHVSQHQHRFTLRMLKKLFNPEFQLKLYQECGKQRQYYHPLLLCIRQRQGGLWARTPTAICPRCGMSFRTFSGRLEYNAVTRCCNKMNTLIKKYKELSKSEVLALYERVHD